MNRLIPALLLTVAACSPAPEEGVTYERPTTIPDDAIEVAPGVYYLGEDVDPESGEVMEGHAFVDWAPGYGPDLEEEVELEDELFERRPTGCYASIGFPKWGSAEPWGVGTTGSSGFSASSVRSQMESGIAAWESASGADIFGNYTSTFSGVAKTTADGQNNIQFGSAGGGGTVAVTYVWGSRRTAIFEWDQIYGDEWDWTMGSPNASSFEFLTVATHEIGHAAGMDHPTASCTAETMYAYVDFGETHQITLNAGDIAGINVLY